MDNLFWATTGQGFAFGDLSNSYTVPDLQTSYIKDGEVYTIFDSASPSIQVPDPLFDPFIREILILAGITSYDTSNGLLLSKCSDKMPDLHFMFERRWLTVQPRDYVVKVDKEGTECMILLERGEAPFVILGLPLYVGYYSVHDDRGG